MLPPVLSPLRISEAGRSIVAHSARTQTASIERPLCKLMIETRIVHGELLSLGQQDDISWRTAVAIK
jgi:hypothetical protein